MNRLGVLPLSIVSLLIALVAATGPGSGRSEVAGINSQEAPSSVAAPRDSLRTNATVSPVEDAIAVGHASGSQGEGERVEPTDNERVEQRQLDYEGENGDEDEYEDELKAVAESHEAMSRDDTKNSNASTAGSSGLLDGTFPDSKNFDSREVITVNSSDEDVASNEAITDELDEKYDQEVAELLKYKKQGNGSRTKTKRVPTVKKELSTQKEILIGGNETQVPRTLVHPEDTANRLNEEADAIRRRNAESIGSIKLDDPGHSEGSREGEIAEGNRYSESEFPKKLDKRQETVLRDLKSYLLTEYATEEEQRQKLRELGAQEDALAESLLKLLVKLAENPSRWERVQKLLVNAENELNLSRNVLDAAKRNHESTSTLFPITLESSSDPRKSRKKFKKKKKKKPRHRLSTTTLTPVPATPPPLTTTETPWQTTPVQWRLVAERLFSPPWQQDLQEDTEKTTTSRYNAPQSPRNLASIRELIEENKPKSDLNSFQADRNPIPPDEPGAVGSQRLVRFGKIGGRTSGRIQPHREFTNAYERPLDSDRVPDYEAPEPYLRPRYNQIPPASRDFLRRHEGDYRDDFAARSDGFLPNQEFDPLPRDFPLSKSWPDIAYRYSPPWRAEERSVFPTAAEKWPWRQPQNDAKYWPQRNFLPVEKSYWSPLSNEEDAVQEAEAEKMWQPQRSQHSWSREGPRWSAEKPAKAPAPWQQADRPAKLYDRDQSNGAWDKSKNRSELNKPPASQDTKDKVVLPQITMKTWNSLTSDPATWPHKLPGAKPWPKDENGKSYNPNADLVKKLGLDEQNSEAWNKGESEKSSAARKAKEEKQIRLFSAKEFVKGSELPQAETSKYKSNDDRSNFGDYKARSGDAMKSWAMLADSKGPKEWIKSGDAQDDDHGAWRRKYDEKNSWPGDAALPKIQSVGAWVMSADQSTWKPYQIKPMEPSEEGYPGRWSKSYGRSSADIKWPGKGGWSEKVNDSWMDEPNTAAWSDKANVPDIWPGKSNKPGSWYAKDKDSDAWSPKSSNPGSWKVKEREWPGKPESASWMSKVADNNNSWPTRGGSWSTKSNESWTSKTNDDASKFNGDSWPVKVKDEDSNDAWSRKANEQNGWVSKSAELSPWQRKINDEWAYGKSSSTGTWPTKWKQFAYHRVTAVPISKPGTAADAASSKSKNAFVAVSAVSSSKYGGNEWRKNEEDPRNENGRMDEQERPGNQLQVGLERPIYAWKKDPGLRVGSAKANSSDPLENQLEALRQIDFWSYKENEAEKKLTSTSAITETTPPAPTNSTSPTVHRRGGPTTENVDSPVETNRRAISMK